MHHANSLFQYGGQRVGQRLAVPCGQGVRTTCAYVCREHMCVRYA